ncbi:MAG: hypothetical protein PGN26_06965 [Xylophilus ampelinus]
MQTEFSADPAVRLSLLAVADVQDALLVAMHDLGRLEGLLGHATDNLLERFGSANAGLAHLSSASMPLQSESLDAVRDALRQAVTELQFQDMASQLIAHTKQILQGCAFQLAAESMGHEEDAEAAPAASAMPGRPNPVTQSEMDAGSIELF